MNEEAHVWEVGRLGDNAEVRARIGWRGLAASEYTLDGPYLIAGKHIVGGEVDWEHCDHLTRRRYVESLEIALEPGDVIISKDGTLGRTARIDALPGEATINGTMMLIRCRDALDYRFLNHFLNGREFGKFIANKVSGSSIPHIFQRDMVTLELPKPEIQEQRHIAEILDSIDDSIRATERVIAKLEQIGNGVQWDLLTRGLDETSRLRPTLSDEPRLYSESLFGYLPTSWTSRTISSLTSRVGSGVTPRGGEEVYCRAGVIFIRSQNVTKDGLDLSDVAFINDLTHRIMASSAVKEWDVLLNITGASIGRCCYVPSGIGPANTNQHVCCIRLSQATESDAKFLSRVLASDIGQRQIRRLNAGGNREGLNYQQLKEFVVPWPPKEERTLIAERLDATTTSVDVERAGLAKLHVLKLGLLDDLLQCRVRCDKGAA